MNVYRIDNEKIESIQLDSIDLQGQSYFFAIGSSDQFGSLCPVFGLNECQAGQYLEAKHQSAIEVYKEYYHIILNIPGMNNERIISQQVDVFLAKNFIIFLSSEKVEIIEKMQQEILLKSDVLFKSIANPSAKILYTLLDKIVLESFSIIKELERRIESQEEKVLRIGSRGMVNEVIMLRRQVFRFKRVIDPLVYIDDMLILNEIGIIDTHMIKYFNNIKIKFSQLNQDVVNLYQSLANLRESYEAEISNQLNEIMKLFTIISAIFLPLNLIIGIFGMNFEHIPGLSYPYAFYILMAFITFVAGVLLMLFRRNKWL